MDNDLLIDTRDPILRPAVVGLMTVAAGLGTATMYVLQPGIAAVAGSLHASVAEMGIALACGPVGYLLGLALLVPLVDRHHLGRLFRCSSPRSPRHRRSAPRSGRCGCSAR
jgi:hypothetical protein